MRTMLRILLLLSSVLSAHAVLAHGNVGDKIKQLNTKIAAEPNHLPWRFQRGVQWLLNLQADHALDDLEFVAEREPGFPQVQLYLGRSHVLAENWAEAETAFALALIFSNGDVDAQKDVLIQRASFLQQQKRFAAAADDWLRVLQLAENDQADWVLFAARNLYAAGAREPALSLVERSLAQMGGVLLLEEQAIEWLLAQKQYTVVLQRLDRLIENSERPDLWLMRKGDVLLMSAEPQQAHAHYSLALTRFAQLPDYVKQRPANAQQVQLLQQKMAALH